MKFVDKKLALKLKEKGFDKPCFGWYHITTPPGAFEGRLNLNTTARMGADYQFLLKRHFNEYSPNPNLVNAPTIEQVLEWLREEKNIHIGIIPYFTMSTKNHIMYEWNVDVFNVDTKETKEDNENVCLTYVNNDFGYVRYSSFDCIADYDDAILASINFIVEYLI